MKILNDRELIRTNGGASGIVIASAIIGVITFAVGILSGYSNPVKCNN